MTFGKSVSETKELIKAFGLGAAWLYIAHKFAYPPYVAKKAPTGNTTGAKPCASPNCIRKKVNQASNDSHQTATTATSAMTAVTTNEASCASIGSESNKVVSDSVPSTGVLPWIAGLFGYSALTGQQAHVDSDDWPKTTGLQEWPNNQQDNK